MYYSNENDIPFCQWEQCPKKAVTQVFNENCTESIFVCQFHRCVVLINLETAGRLRLDKSSPNLVTVDRPETNPLKPRVVRQRPVSDPTSWEQEAARKADSMAEPIEPFEIDRQEQDVIVPDIPTPRNLDR